MKPTEIGIRLRELRAEKAQRLGRTLSQREVAEHFHVGASAYSGWETGRTKPDIELLPQLAAYFGVSLETMFDDFEVRPDRPDDQQSENGVVWSLRRQVKTEEERLGLQVWRLLAVGESLESAAHKLNLDHLSTKEIKCYLKDIVYTDMISVDYVPQNDELAQRIKDEYQLRDVLVVSRFENSPAVYTTTLLGEVAASYFRQHVHPGMSVGLAGGFSVCRMVHSLKRGDCRSIKVYPLAISPALNVANSALDSNTLVGTLAHLHEGRDVEGYTLQYANRQLREQANSMKQVALTERILMKAQGIDIGFMGLGNLNFRLTPVDSVGGMLRTWGLTRDEVRKEGAIGDILYHFVDKDGELVASTISDHICSIQPQELQKMVRAGTRIVAIAAGRGKAEIFRVAIDAGYANVFIIDEQLAQTLL